MSNPFGATFESLENPTSPVVEAVHEVPYRRLVDLIDSGEGQLISLRAPRAGYGKTMLLSRLRAKKKSAMTIIPIHLADGRLVEGERVLEEVLTQMAELVPGTAGLTKLDLHTRQLFAHGLLPMVYSGEVPSQDKQGALASLKERPTEAFDFHNEGAAIAQWTKSQFDVLSPRLSSVLGKASGVTTRDTAYWITRLFQFAIRTPSEPSRTGDLMNAVFGAESRFRSGSGFLDGLSTLLNLITLVEPAVLVLDEVDGLSSDSDSALRATSSLISLWESSPRVSVIISVNDDVWLSAFAPRLPLGLRDRLEDIVIRLEPLTSEEARALVKIRSNSDTSQLLESLDFSSDNLYPRGVLRAARDAWEKQSAQNSNLKVAEKKEQASNAIGSISDFKSPQASVAVKKAEEEKQALAAKKAEEEKQALAAKKAEEEKQALAAKKAEEEKKALAAKKAEEEKKALAAKKAEEEKQALAAKKAEEEKQALAAKKAAIEKQALADKQALAAKAALAVRQATEAKARATVSSKANYPPLVVRRVPVPRSFDVERITQGSKSSASVSPQAGKSAPFAQRTPDGPKTEKSSAAAALAASSELKKKAVSSSEDSVKEALANLGEEKSSSFDVSRAGSNEKRPEKTPFSTSSPQSKNTDVQKNISSPFGISKDQASQSSVAASAEPAQTEQVSPFGIAAKKAATGTKSEEASPFAVTSSPKPSSADVRKQQASPFTVAASQATSADVRNEQPPPFDVSSSQPTSADVRKGQTVIPAARIPEFVPPSQPQVSPFEAARPPSVAPEMPFSPPFDNAPQAVEAKTTSRAYPSSQPPLESADVVVNQPAQATAAYSPATEQSPFQVKSEPVKAVEQSPFQVKSEPVKTVEQSPFRVKSEPAKAVEQSPFRVKPEPTKAVEQSPFQENLAPKSVPPQPEVPKADADAIDELLRQFRDHRES